MAMRLDELRRVVVIAEVLGKGRAAHADLDILANLQMQVRVIKPVRRSHGGNLLATSHGLAFANKNVEKMPIKGIDRSNRAALAVTVPHDDDVAPAHMTVPRKNDQTVANAINRVAQIGVAASDAVPIFSKMSVRTKPARLIITLRIGSPDRKIESIREFRERSFEMFAVERRNRPLCRTFFNVS